MNVTEQHLHHFAKRHHSLMRKFEGLRSRLSGVTEGAVQTLEVGAGAWLGGLVEGKTAGGTVLHVPINLGVGVGLSVLGLLDVLGTGYSAHLNNLGAGFIGSYAAATGYSFGKRWRETGKLFAPKAAAVPLPPTPEAMAQMAAQMHAAAAGG